jgi:hypothetical protein
MTTTYGGRMHFPAAPRPASPGLPPGYMAHTDGGGYIVSLQDEYGTSFLCDAHGNTKKFVTPFWMQLYCEKHAAQGLRSDEVPV